jgi:hypothetical protein
MKKVILIFCLSLFSYSTWAEIYRSVNENGVVTYSDQPNPKAESVKLPAANISTQPTQPSQKTQTTDTVEKKLGQHVDYTAFEINSPKDQDTFQNATEFPISVTINPALQEGDKIQFLLDGTPILSPVADTGITIPKVQDGKELVERGSHTISAQIINAQGDVIATTPGITIFVHYVTLYQTQKNKK